MTTHQTHALYSLFGHKFSIWAKVGIILASVGVSLVVSAVLRGYVANATLLPFFGAVAISAFFAGVPGALAAGVASYMCVEYFFIMPLGQVIPTPENMGRAIVFVLLSVFVGWIQELWRKAWEAQSRTRQELESVLATAADGVVMLDSNLNVQYANAQVQRILGLEAPLQTGTSIIAQLESAAGFCDEMEQSLKVGDLPFNEAIQQRRGVEALFGCGPKGGPYSRWITLRVAPALNEDQSLQSLVAVITDSSAQRRSLRKAQEERNRLMSIFEVLSDAVIVSDQDGAVTMLNTAAEQLLAWEREAAVGHMINEVYRLEPVEAAALVLQEVGISEELPKELPAESVLVTESGSRIPVTGRIIPLPERTGKLVILRDRREEDALERQRQQAEQRLRDMIENIVCQVALLATDGQVLEYNGARVPNNGVPYNLLTAPLSSHGSEHNPNASLPPAFVQAFERALAGEITRLDFEIGSEDSDPRSFDMQTAPLYDEEGRVNNVVFSAVDITERKQAQQTTTMLASIVNAERKRMEDILESVPAIIWEGTGMPGHNHHITFVNHYTEQLLGYSQDDWIARTHPWQSIMHPEDVGEAIALMQQRMRDNTDGPATPIQFRAYAKDGTVLMLEMRMVVIRNDDGEALGLRGIALDITAQKEAERRISQLMKLVDIGRKRLQDTVDAVPALVFEAVGPPEAQRLVFVSSFAETLSGYSAQEWLDEPTLPMSIILPEDAQHVQEVSHANYYEEKGLPVHYRIRTRDNLVRWVEARVSIVKDADDKPIGVRGVTTDITDLREKEIELRRSNEELQQFAYVASHDLQEPLRMVTSYLQLIEQRYGDQLDEQAHEFIGFAVGGAVRMKQLITDLLTYSRVQTNRGEFRPVDTNAVLDTVRQNLAPMLTDTGGVIESERLPHVFGNTTLLTQLFQNLINNALKFRGAEPPHIRIAAVPQGSGWRFSVSDNGIGFDERYAERVFILFQRLHSQARYSGTGIGLAICKKVVESHSGEIWAESKPGHGSTFFFTLPSVHSGVPRNA